MVYITKNFLYWLTNDYLCSLGLIILDLIVKIKVRLKNALSIFFTGYIKKSRMTTSLLGMLLPTKKLEMILVKEKVDLDKVRVFGLLNLI